MPEDKPTKEVITNTIKEVTKEPLLRKIEIRTEEVDITVSSNSPKDDLRDISATAKINFEFAYEKKKKEIVDYV